MIIHVLPQLNRLSSKHKEDFERETIMTAFITSNPKRFNWQMIVVSSLAFWLSSSILLDFIIMPSMFFTGMMEEPNFASAGYSLFSIFNRVELLCAAVILTGAVTLRMTQAAKFGGRQGALLALSLLAIALTYTLAWMMFQPPPS
jgi:Domain of unknown function (DUF4149)